MEQQLNALCVLEVRRLTSELSGNKQSLVLLYQSYPDFSKMYEQLKPDETGTYDLLCSICAAYIACSNNLISDRKAVELYQELKAEYEEKKENTSLEAKEPTSSETTQN